MINHKYGGLNEIIVDLNIVKPNFSAREGEVAFIAPKNLDGWYIKIYHCLVMVDILWGKSERIVLENDYYKFIFKSSLFQKPTTISVGYDPSNYTFIVNSRWTLLDEVSDRSKLVAIAQAYERYFFDLLRSMKSVLPKARYDDVVSRCDIPKRRVP